MSYKVSQQPKKIARVRSLFAAALVLACAFGTVTRAAAQKVTPPPTPTDITPEAGNSAFFGRPRHWFARLYVPAYEHRWHFLDS